MSGNAWTTNNRRSRDSPTQEQHIPVKGFNAQETRDALKKAIASVAAEDLKSLRYKATGGPAANVKTGGPWASKDPFPNNSAVNTMSSGKDFFLELRKQMAALQHVNERAGG
ncbi:MAG: hypothetical protein Q9187_003881 [Circinaria calcarea]